MVKHNAGHCAFPKGHVEEGETEFETAIRETKEETGIDVEIISDKRFVNTYSPKEDVIKDVIFFIAKPLNIDLTRQESEIADLRWIDIDKASEYITFDDDRKLYLEVLDIYKNEYR
jgi:8-oxo-dGTP pyrophosphatase MutT (NUDIX family)